MSDPKRPPQDTAQIESEPPSSDPVLTTSSNVLTASDGVAVINAFGGIRPMAAALEVAVSTVQGWKDRNQIPDNRWDDVLKAAAKSEVSLMKSSHKDDQNLASSAEDQTEHAQENGPTIEEAPITQAAETAPQAVTPQKTGSAGTGLFACLLALVALVAIATRGYWGPVLDPIMIAHLSNYFGPLAMEKEKKRETDALSEQLDAQAKALTSSLQSIDVALATIAEEERQARRAFTAEIEKQLATLTEEMSAKPTLSTLDLETLADRLLALETAQETLATMGSDEATRNALSAFRGRLDALSQNVEDGLARFRDAVGGASDRSAALTTRLNGLEDALDEVQQALADITENGTYSNQSMGPSIANGPLLLAVGQVETAIGSGADPVGPLQLLREIAVGRERITQAIVSLEQAVESQGRAQSLSTLVSEFDALAPLIDKADRIQGADGWVEETLATLRGLVSVRKTGDDPDLPIASQIEAALQNADLGTVIHLSKPYEEADPEIATWVSKAEARLALDTAIENLRQTALAEIGSALKANPGASR